MAVIYTSQNVSNAAQVVNALGTFLPNAGWAVNYLGNTCNGQYTWLSMEKDSIYINITDRYPFNPGCGAPEDDHWFFAGIAEGYDSTKNYYNQPNQRGGYWPFGFMARETVTANDLFPATLAIVASDDPEDLFWMVNLKCIDGDVRSFGIISIVNFNDVSTNLNRDFKTHFLVELRSLVEGIEYGAGKTDFKGIGVRKYADGKLRGYFNGYSNRVEAWTSKRNVHFYGAGFNAYDEMDLYSDTASTSNGSLDGGSNCVFAANESYTVFLEDTTSDNYTNNTAFYGTAPDYLKFHVYLGDDVNRTTTPFTIGTNQYLYVPIGSFISTNTYYSRRGFLVRIG